jgi:hypothetical protein
MDSTTFDEKIIYICDNINELRKPHRIEILQLILGSNINRDKIKEKGCGTQIKINDIPRELIPLLYNFIRIKMKAQEDELFEVNIHKMKENHILVDKKDTSEFEPKLRNKKKNCK